MKRKKKNKYVAVGKSEVREKLEAILELKMGAKRSLVPKKARVTSQSCEQPTRDIQTFQFESEAPASKFHSFLWFNLRFPSMAKVYVWLYV
jgi:hypothetical protein